MNERDEVAWVYNPSTQELGPFSATQLSSRLVLRLLPPPQIIKKDKKKKKRNKRKIVEWFLLSAEKSEYYRQVNLRQNVCPCIFSIKVFGYLLHWFASKWWNMTWQKQKLWNLFCLRLVSGISEMLQMWLGSRDRIGPRNLAVFNWLKLPPPLPLIAYPLRAPDSLNGGLTSIPSQKNHRNDAVFQVWFQNPSHWCH